MYKILIVEDDKSISTSIATYLRDRNYEPIEVVDFKNILKLFKEKNPHFIIMDVSLPFFNGYHWCQEIRKVSTVPILFLSSADESLNQVMGMQLGGDGYLTKPFSMNVLEANIHALLRRYYDFVQDKNRLFFQEVQLDRQKMTVTYGRKNLELTKNEYRILEKLMEVKGAVVSRDELMNHLWQSDIYIDDNTLTVNVARLRKALASIEIQNFIQTKKGVGYYANFGLSKS